jgi:hypothetical protein
MKEFVDAAPVTAYSLAISRFAVVFFADCLSLSLTAVIAKTSQEQPQGEFQCKGDINGVQSRGGVKLALKYLLLYTPLRSKGYMWLSR